MKVKGSLLFSLLMLAIFCGMLFMSMGYSEKARFVPLVVGIPGLFLSAVQVAIEIRDHFKVRLTESKSVARKELVIICWIMFQLGLILIFGFWVAIPVFLLLFLRVHGKESWILTITIAACGWGIIFLIFNVLAKVPLYGGVLGLDLM